MWVLGGLGIIIASILLLLFIRTPGKGPSFVWNDSSQGRSHEIHEALHAGLHLAVHLLRLASTGKPLGQRELQVSFKGDIYIYIYICMAPLQGRYIGLL